MEREREIKRKQKTKSNRSEKGQHLPEINVPSLVPVNDQDSLVKVPFWISSDQIQRTSKDPVNNTG